jgi:primosomal replication protein N
LNHLVLTAGIAELEAMRYTPAGLPALNMRLEHESTVQEAGQSRQVKAAVKAVAFGAQAERLAKQAIGSQWRLTGFLASARNGKSVVFHIQDISQEQKQDDKQDQNPDPSLQRILQD